MPLRLSSIIIAILAVALWSTNSRAAPRPEQLAQRVEEAHNADAYRKQDGVAADMKVIFGGNTVLEGKLIFDTPVGRSRMELNGSKTLVFDGAHAWVSPPEAQVPQARFHLLTWPYFIAAPMKLRDPGTHLTAQDPVILDGQRYPAFKVTFGEGVGDTPEDWYLVLVDPESGRLRAMAYIVTYGADAPAETLETHLAIYDRYTTIEGVPLPARITFHDVTSQTDRQLKFAAEPTGMAEFGNYRFIEPAQDAFTKPAEAREDPLP